MKNSEEKSPYIGAISKCFTGFLSIYRINVERKLTDLIDKFTAEAKTYKYEINHETTNVLPFCGDLFTSYKSILVEYLKLGSSEEVVQLAELFKKYLRIFCTKILQGSLPKFNAAPKDLTAMFAQVQTLFDSHKMNDDVAKQDICKICCLLCSAEYCEEMVGRLAAKMKEKEPNLIGFEKEEDCFHLVLTEVG